MSSHLRIPSLLTRNAQFRIERFTPEAIVIRDVGPWNRHPTVTNDAENVVRTLDPAPLQRIFYYDSDGTLDELCHSNGEFSGFAPGPRELPAEPRRALPRRLSAMDQVRGIGE